MEDSAIIDLYFARSENAITETATKYGKMLMGVSVRILRSIEDAEEALSDTYMKTWNSIPPTRPNIRVHGIKLIKRNVPDNLGKECRQDIGPCGRYTVPCLHIRIA